MEPRRKINLEPPVRFVITRLRSDQSTPGVKSFNGQDLISGSPILFVSFNRYGEKNTGPQRSGATKNNHCNCTKRGEFTYSLYQVSQPTLGLKTTLTCDMIEADSWFSIIKHGGHLVFFIYLGKPP